MKKEDTVKVVKILFALVFINLIVPTLWYNWGDTTMNVLKDRFDNDYYGETKVTEELQDPKGLLWKHNGGIFKERDTYLKSENIRALADCKWTSHEATGEGTYRSTLCLYVWWPFT